MLCIVPDVVIHKRTLIRVCQAYAPDSGRYPHHSHMSSTDVSPAVSTCPPSLDAYCPSACAHTTSTAVMAAPRYLVYTN